VNVQLVFNLGSLNALHSHFQCSSNEFSYPGESSNCSCFLRVTSKLGMVLFFEQCLLRRAVSAYCLRCASVRSSSPFSKISHTIGLDARGSNIPPTWAARSSAIQFNGTHRIPNCKIVSGKSRPRALNRGSTAAPHTATPILHPHHNLHPANKSVMHHLCIQRPILVLSANADYLLSFLFLPVHGQTTYEFTASFGKTPSRWDWARS
jgi:hypothetical protein